MSRRKNSRFLIGYGIFFVFLRPLGRFFMERMGFPLSKRDKGNERNGAGRKSRNKGGKHPLSHHSAALSESTGIRCFSLPGFPPPGKGPCFPFLISVRKTAFPPAAKW